jgi:hypothetical protein
MSMTERTPHLQSSECASRNRGARNSDSAVGGKLLTRGELSCGEEEEVAWVRGSFSFPGGSASPDVRKITHPNNVGKIA